LEPAVNKYRKPKAEHLFKTKIKDILIVDGWSLRRAAKAIYDDRGLRLKWFRAKLIAPAEQKPLWRNAA
jgi:hypothetical protein